MNSSPPNAGPPNSRPEQDLFQQLGQEIDAWPMQEGIRTTDLTLLNEPLRGVLNATVRESFMTLPHFAEGLNLTLEHDGFFRPLLLCKPGQEIIPKKNYHFLG